MFKIKSSSIRTREARPLVLNNFCNLWIDIENATLIELETLICIKRKLPNRRNTNNVKNR